MSFLPHLGHGIGLRPAHYGRVLDGTLKADWFEVISENFMIDGGRPLQVLEAARRQAPVVMHGVSMSLGGTDPIDERYLTRLSALIERVEPAWVSDHLCWGSYAGSYAHDLLPLPYTEEALRHVGQRIRRVQDLLGRRILIENVSSYVTFKHSTMPEWEFVRALAQDADCGILLDVNNIYVSAVNHGFAPNDYLDAVPFDRVGQIHLAGHQNNDTHIVDTHDHPVCAEVWEVYRAAVQRGGGITSLIERDANIPEVEELLAEADQARRIEVEVLRERRTLAA